jgi:hypothetical protein
MKGERVGRERGEKSRTHFFPAERSKRNAQGSFELRNINGEWYPKPTSCINTEHGEVSEVFDFLSCQVGVTYSDFSCCYSYITFYKSANCAGEEYEWMMDDG